MRQLNSNAPWCTCTTRKNGWTLDGVWWVCGNCRKPSQANMNECDTCGKKFKGFKPNLPFAYTCEDCE